jgi:protocatechuate 3,4-dioxygenase beta subunit
MRQQSIALFVGALILLAVGALVLPQWFADDAPPLVRWQAQDEIEVPDEGAANGDVESAGFERTVVEASDAPLRAGDDEARVEVLLRGRVVDRYRQPVAAARVWLDFARGSQRGGPAGQRGRQRRVPDPVQTDREGQFAFQGQAFANLRVSLQVAHPDHAAGLFEKDLGQIDVEADVGDLVLQTGGELLGRVTDLEGNGIADAAVRLQPENGNAMRWVRDRDNLLAELRTDGNGFFRHGHAPAGDWTAVATAPRHTEGRSPTFAVEDDRSLTLDDIRLGPGFEVTGYVRDVQGKPIARAEVTMRGEMRGGRGDRGDRGERQGRTAPDEARAALGREHRATTDVDGRFALDHLPGVPMRLEARADGYLDALQEGVDVTQVTQPIAVTLQDGLRIAGTVLDGVDGAPVTRFAVRAIRLRGLPAPGAVAAENELAGLFARMRAEGLDDAARQQLRARIEQVRATTADARRGGRPAGGPGGPGAGNRGDGGRQNDLGRAERHPDGTFVATGLQEGIYEVQIQSPDHARFRSEEIELRLHASPPALTARLDRGVFVAGVVLDANGEPVRGARVELRGAGGERSADGAARGRRGRGEDAGGPGREFLRQFAAAVATLDATTDAEGVFVVQHAVRGTYTLRASARGHDDAATEPFELSADRSGFELRLGALGSLAGRVLGLQPSELAEARVAAVPIGDPSNGGWPLGRGRGGNGPFDAVAVQLDGTYRIAELAPGAYLVRAWIGSPQELMRELAPQFFDNSLAADVTVRAGEAASLDVAVTRPQIGTVSGTVLHNGAPATGFQVELARADDGAADAGSRDPRTGGRGEGGGRGLMNAMRRSFQATVAASGQFTIRDVPAGAYRLRVQTARRTGALHEEPVQVTANGTVTLQIHVSSSVVEGTLTRDDGDAAELLGTAWLLPDATSIPENFGAWVREHEASSTRVRAGKFRFDSVRAGSYLLVAMINGRDRTSVPLQIAGIGAQTVSIAAGKVASAPPGGGAAPPHTNPR